jgi:hypothetical protein
MGFETVRVAIRRNPRYLVASAEGGPAGPEDEVLARLLALNLEQAGK